MGLLIVKYTLKYTLNAHIILSIKDFFALEKVMQNLIIRSHLVLIFKKFKSRQYILYRKI